MQPDFKEDLSDYALEAKQLRGFPDNVALNSTGVDTYINFITDEDDQDLYKISYSQVSKAMYDVAPLHCVKLVARYVQKLIDQLNSRFPDLGVFNAAKLFSSAHYASALPLR